MAKKALMALAALAAAIAIIQPAQADADLEITAPDNGREYVTTGSIEIVVGIRNNGPDDAENISLLLDIDGGVTYSSGSIARLSAGQTRVMGLRVTGYVEEAMEADIHTYSDVAGVRDDRVGIVLLPPETGLRIESPKGEISLVGIPENGSAGMGLTVRNSGEIRLEGVAVTIERASAGMSCGSTGPQNIEPGKTAGYSITCNNVSSGKSFKLKVADASGKASDTETVTLRLVEQMLPTKLEIVSPLENAELRLPESGGAIRVAVRNGGLANLTGVCAYAEGVQYNSSECKDLASNRTAEFNIALFPEQDLTFVRLVAGDSRGKADDDVVVRVLRLQVKQQAVEPDGAGNGPNEDGTQPAGGAQNWTQNASGQWGGEQDGSAAVNERSGPFGLPQGPFNILIIVVPLLILGVYIKIRVSRANED